MAVKAALLFAQAQESSLSLDQSGWGGIQGHEPMLWSEEQWPDMPGYSSSLLQPCWGRNRGLESKELIPWAVHLNMNASVSDCA